MHAGVKAPQQDKFELSLSSWTWLIRPTEGMIEENAALMNIPIKIFESDIFGVVVDVDQSPLLSVRAHAPGFYLYDRARSLGCNKIALGHHYDDVIETILMSMLYGGQVNTMMPKLHSTNFPGMELIRPLYFVKEGISWRWKDYNKLHFLQCACRFTEQIARSLRPGRRRTPTWCTPPSAGRSRS